MRAIPGLPARVVTVEELTSLKEGPVMAGCQRRYAYSAVVAAFCAPMIRKSGRGRNGAVARP
jgi:hypothetical protein